MTEQERQAALDALDILVAHCVLDDNFCNELKEEVRAALSSPAVTNGGLQDFACKVSDMLWGGELGWTRTGLDGMFNELKKRMSSPIVPVIPGLDEALGWYSKININELKQIEHPMYYLLTASRAYAALPKLQKVDLGGMEIEIPLTGGWKSIKCSIDNAESIGYNRAIDDIKSKYGELYAEVKE